MKKAFSILLCVLTLSLALTACGGKSLDINTVATSVETVCAIQNPAAYTDDDLVYDMSLDMEKIDSYTGNRSNITGASACTLVIKAKSGEAENIKTALETYIEKQTSTLNNYAEFAEALAQAKEARVVASGDVVILALAAEGVDYATVDAAIADATK
jgi:pectin methylesterase-like acyl-CoA thioesterase